MNQHPEIVCSSHRGAYDRLWSEFRHVVLAVSLKASSRFARKLGAVPTRTLSLLEDLAGFCAQPRLHVMQSLLQAYLLLKPHLSRSERRGLIDGFLAHDPNALDLFFSLGLVHRVEALYGCRLLFPPAAPIRFFDQQDRPGIWHCLGPYLLLLRGNLLKRWVCRSTILESKADFWLTRLQTGIHQREYLELPRDFRERLERLGGIANPGIRVWTHPYLLRAWTDREPFESDPVEVAVLLALAEWWDQHLADIPLLPETDVWLDQTERLAEELALSVSSDVAKTAVARVREGFREAAEREAYTRTGWEETQQSLEEDQEEQEPVTVVEDLEDEDDG